MEVTITGKHISIGDSLRVHIEESLKSRVKRYFENAISANVTISKNNSIFHSNVIVNDGTGRGVVIKSNNEDADPYNSVDGAIQKAERQLQKYKERFKDKHKVRSVRDPEVLDELMATKYVLAASDHEVLDECPIVVAERQSPLLRITVSDAVMHMDLMDLTTLLFINLESGMISVVYRRKDGKIAWIETQIPYMLK